MAMTYDDYLKDAEAKKNKTTSYYDSATNEALASYTNQMQLQKDYAQGVYDRGVSYAEGMKNTAYTAAEQQRAQAERDAEISYQRQAADAQAARYLDSAYYGAKGEQIARMGLGASGYSDYLESRAYQTSRAEAQAAAQQRDAIGRNARDAEAGAKLNADMTYNNYLNSAANDRDKAFADADLTYSQNALAAQQAAREGKMNAEMQFLADKAAAQEKEDAANDKNISNYAKYLQMVSSGDYSKDQLDQFAKMFGISGEQKEIANDKVESNFDRLLAAGQYQDALNEIDGDILDGKIESSDYKNKTNAVMNAVIQNIPTAHNDDEEGKSLADAMTYLDGKRNVIGENEYQRLKKELYKKYYGIKETNGKQYNFKYTGNGSFAVDEKAHKLFRTSVAADSVAQKLSSVVDGEDFYMAEYDGDAYIYYDGKWRKVTGQTAGWNANNYLKTAYFTESPNAQMTYEEYLANKRK